MTNRLTILGGTDWANGEVLYAADLNDTISNMDGALGEIKKFALSISGAITKSTLQTRGWAICDGTTPASQGISSPTIATTPNLENLFLRASDDETSGSTGGATTHSHTVSPPSRQDNVDITVGGTDDVWYGSGNGSTNTVSNLPPYYEVALFIKVKI